MNVLSGISSQIRDSGRQIALSLIMILVTIKMKVPPEKRKELYQAVACLVGSIRKEKGCRRCDFCRSLGDGDEFCLLGEWESREDLAAHLKSEPFKVLLGAMSLLRKPHELKIYSVS